MSNADWGVGGNGNQPEKNMQNTDNDSRKQLLDLIKASEDKHFVFLFGSPAAGKTAVLGCILQAMQRPEAPGKLFVHGAGGGYFKAGLALWNRVSDAFSAQRFPSRSTKNETIQLHAQYRVQEGVKPLNIVFLEMAGEDLKSVNITDQGGRSLPFHIGQFLRIPTLKLSFLITTPWDEADKDDALIDSFLSYVNETAPHLIENRFILLVTKWDKNQSGNGEAIDEFVRSKMPRTYNKLAAKRNVIQPFSVGTVIPFDGSDGDIIAQFDHAASQRLFARIYETFTGISSEPTKPKLTLLQRLWK